MEKKECNLNSKILGQLDGHPNKKEILEILSEDPDKEFKIEESENEMIEQQIKELIQQLSFNITNENNYFECRVYFGEEYVGFVSYEIEGSTVKIIDFGTANKRGVADDISYKLRDELSRMRSSSIRYLGFAILYYLFEEWKKKMYLNFFEIVSSKGSIEFYRKFFEFMEDLGKVELLENRIDNWFKGELL